MIGEIAISAMGALSSWERQKHALMVELELAKLQMQPAPRLYVDPVRGRTHEIPEYSALPRPRSSTAACAYCGTTNEKRRCESCGASK